MPQFRARILKFCEQLGAVVPQNARDHDLGSKIVKRCVLEHHMRGLSLGFVPVEVAAAAALIGKMLLTESGWDRYSINCVSDAVRR